MATTSRKKTPLPDTFYVNEDMRSWARLNVPGLNLEEETAAFKDYAAGHDWKMVDWTATWRNWMRREYKKAKPRNYQANVPTPYGAPGQNKPKDDGPDIHPMMARANMLMLGALIRTGGVDEATLERMVQAKNRVVEAWQPYPDEISREDFKDLVLKQLRMAYRAGAPT
jgi:hypothetical protein